MSKYLKLVFENTKGEEEMKITKILDSLTSMEVSDVMNEIVESGIICKDGDVFVTPISASSIETITKDISLA